VLLAHGAAQAVHPGAAARTGVGVPVHEPPLAVLPAVHLRDPQPQVLGGAAVDG
jgi:hypothetical protein